jgi:hypothetical protein
MGRKELIIAKVKLHSAKCKVKRRWILAFAGMTD